MCKSLIDHFAKIEDPRKASGLRHPLVPFLAMSTLAMLSGYKGFREIGAFMAANQQSFEQLFKLKHGVPGFVQIRTIFSMLDFSSVNEAFYNWAIQFVPIEKGEWLSGDGKGLSSTVVHPHDAKQDFVLMVSLFSQKTGTVLMTQRKNNGKGGEVPALKELLEKLELKGIVLTLDALHCKKNSCSNH